MKLMLLLLTLLFSPLALSQQQDDQERKQTYLGYLLYAANHYWSLDNYEGYIMVFNEVELVEPRFSSSFNLALGMFHLGEYKQAMNKLTWLEKRYQLSDTQQERVNDLRLQIEHHFNDYHGLSYVKMQHSVCKTRSDACLHQLNALPTENSLVETLPAIETELLLVGQDIDSPQQLSRKFEQKLLL